MTLPDLGDPDTYLDGLPHELARRLRQEAPVAWWLEPASAGLEGGPGVWAITRHRDIIAATRRSDFINGISKLPVRLSPGRHGARLTATLAGS